MVERKEEIPPSVKMYSGGGRGAEAPSSPRSGRGAQRRECPRPLLMTLGEHRGKGICMRCLVVQSLLNPPSCWAPDCQCECRTIE